MESQQPTVPTAQPGSKYAYDLPQKRYIKISKKHNEERFQYFPEIKQAINEVIAATEHYRTGRKKNEKDDEDYQARRMKVDAAQKKLDALSLDSLDAQQNKINHINLFKILSTINMCVIK